MVLADAKQVVNVTAYKDGAVYGTCSESVESYIARQSSGALKDLGTAIMKFSTSAYNYLSA